MYWEMKKLKEFYQKIKNFKLTKYLLDRKERKLLNDIEFNKRMIESYERRIKDMYVSIERLSEKIIEKQELIKELETNVKKIQTVSKLY